MDFKGPDGGVSEALSAPVTEVATFYYDEAPPETSFEGAKTLIEALQNDGVKFQGWAFGTTHEVIERDGFRGKKPLKIILIQWTAATLLCGLLGTETFAEVLPNLGKANVLVAGWETVEAHLDSHNTQALKDNIHRLTTKDVKTYEM